MQRRRKRYDTIIDALTAQGIKTKTGGSFGKNSLSAILRNEKYSGVFVFNRQSRAAKNSHQSKPDAEVIRIPGGIPQIVDEDIWQLVQDRLNNHKRNAAPRAKYLYLLSGKLVCGECGAAMIGSCSTSGQSHTRYPFYVCGARQRKHTCNLPRFGAAKLEKTILDAIYACFDPSERDLDAVLKIIRENMQKEPEETRNARTELKAVKRQVNGIIAAMKAGAHHQRLLEELDTLAAREEALNRFIADAPIPREVTREDVKEFISGVLELQCKPREQQQSFIRSFVDKITVHASGAIKISFRVRVPTVAGDGLEPTTSGL